MQEFFPADLIALLRRRPPTAVLTGAGISAESGVPTFRDARTGLWARYGAMELATPEAFQRNPRLVWRWYEWRRDLVRAAAPNDGHRALATLQDALTDYTLITQNVDDLHRAAGSTGVLELHGNIERTICSRDGTPIEHEAGLDNPPGCPRCGSPGRPDVVWFGEALPVDSLQAAVAAARGCELFFSVGTSSAVEPAASLPWMALEAGATVVEVNPARTALSPSVHYALVGPAGRVLPALVRNAFGARV